MRLIATFGLVSLAAVALSRPQDYRTTPVPILKQINRHNDDGSYSYGYEGADGTYKIETKYPTGEVYGKYGYVGDDGKLREVEYGASKRGFEPSGADINVAPPTLSNSIEPNNADFDDGEYREDLTNYYRKPAPAKIFSSRFPTRNAFTNKFQSPAYQAPQYYQPQPQYYHPQAQFQYYNPQPRFPKFTFDPAIFNGHPATNFDINTGSYTISYTG